jgi:chemotaxis protein MotB
MRNTALNTAPTEDVSEGLPLKRTTRGLSRFRKEETQPEKGGDIWLYTLSDLLLLLVIFFVLLFGMTLSKQEKNTQSLQAAVGVAEVRQEAPVEIPPARIQAPDPPAEEKTSGLEADLVGALKNESSQQEVAIERRADILVLTFPEPIVFDPGQAQLKFSAQSILEKVASVILDRPNLTVEVQGHTDNRPINTQRYPSNWELSVDRATQVARALIRLGVDPNQLSVKGFGEYRALYPNDTEENQFKNRRVEIQFSLAPKS